MIYFVRGNPPAPFGWRLLSLLAQIVDLCFFVFVSLWSDRYLRTRWSEYGGFSVAVLQWRLWRDAKRERGKEGETNG